MHRIRLDIKQHAKEARIGPARRLSASSARTSQKRHARIANEGPRKLNRPERQKEAQGRDDRSEMGVSEAGGGDEEGGQAGEEAPGGAEEEEDELDEDACRGVVRRRE